MIRALSTGLFTALLLAGCTSRDPLFCDEAHGCAEGQRCNLERRTCEPIAAPDQGSPGPLGATCGDAGRCQSGFCVDGVCCEAECAGACRSCAVPGHEGSCQPAPDGTDDRKLCAGSAPACAGTCQEGVCRFPEGQPCADPSCETGQRTTSACDASGACQDSSVSCGGYACAGASCLDKCSSGGDCVVPFTCTLGSCTSDQPAGSPCGSNPKACASGHCVDGVCCEADGCPTCQACNLNGKGTCQPASDGTGCGTTTCKAGVRQSMGCKAGSCETTTQSCDVYDCNSAQTDCLTACGAGGGCSDSAYCEATVCKPKKANGVSCGSGLECSSGTCTAGEKVCCDTACTGDCETCAGKASCSPKPVGTPCGDQKSYCQDGATSSSVMQPACDASRNCVPTTVAECTPYRCRAGQPPSCATGCTTQAECTTVCDLFQSLDTCRPSGEVCFVDLKTCPNAGAGTQSSPYCQIQSCLDALKPYVAIADGKYLENLVSKGTVQMVSTGTSGPLWQGVYPPTNLPKVLLDPRKPSTDGLLVQAGHKVFVYGLDLSHIPPSSPPSSSDPSGLLVEVKSSGELSLRTCHVHNVNGSACIVANGAKVTLEDSIAVTCASYGLKAEATDVSLTSGGIAWSTTGLFLDTGKLTLRDVVLRFNGTAMFTYHATLDVDRVRIDTNLGDGMDLQNNTTGLVTNLLVAGNAGKGIAFRYTPSPPTFVNITVAGNSGTAVEGDTYTYSGSSPADAIFYSSIIRGSLPSLNRLSVLFSDVESSALGCGWPCAGSFNQDPQFGGSGATEYYSLHPTSPCIDAGTDAAPGLPTRDLLNNPRQVDLIPGGSKVDMGAFELQP